jgi:hypothetical protein
MLAAETPKGSSEFASELMVKVELSLSDYIRIHVKSDPFLQDLHPAVGKIHRSTYVKPVTKESFEMKVGLSIP